MKKMKFTRTLMLALAIAGAGVVTSCKDYDEDNYYNAAIGNGGVSMTALQNQIKELQEKVFELTTKIHGCKCEPVKLYYNPATNELTLVDQFAAETVVKLNNNGGGTSIQEVFRDENGNTYVKKEDGTPLYIPEVTKEADGKVYIWPIIDGVRTQIEIPAATTPAAGCECPTITLNKGTDGNVSSVTIKDKDGKQIELKNSTATSCACTIKIINKEGKYYIQDGATETLIPTSTTPTTVDFSYDLKKDTENGWYYIRLGEGANKKEATIRPATSKVSVIKEDGKVTALVVVEYDMDGNEIKRDTVSLATGTSCTCTPSTSCTCTPGQSSGCTCTPSTSCTCTPGQSSGCSCGSMTSCTCTPGQSTSCTCTPQDPCKCDTVKYNKAVKDLADVIDILNGKDGKDGLIRQVEKLDSALNAEKTIIKNNRDSIAINHKDIEAANEAIEAAEKQIENNNDSIKQLFKIIMGENGTEANPVEGSVLYRLNEIEDAIDDLTERVEDLEDARTKQITGIIIQQVKNPVFGSYNSISTNVQTNMLMAYYGTASRAFEFPEVADGFPAPEVTYKKQSENTIVADGNNAGALYVTINPTDLDYKDFEGFELVNSLGKPCGITLGKVQESSSALTLGYSRAAGDAVYMVPAYLPAANVDNYPGLHINIDKGAVKDALSDLIKTRNKSQAVATVKEMAEVAINVAKEVNSLEAQGVKCTWEDAYGTHSVYSNFNIGALAVKALGFNTLDGVSTNSLFDKARKAIDKIKKQVDDRVIARINKELEKYNEKISQRAIYKVEDTGLGYFKVTVNYEGNADVKPAIEAINAQYIAALGYPIILDIDEAKKHIVVRMDIQDMEGFLDGLDMNDIANLNKMINDLLKQINNTYDKVLAKEPTVYNKVMEILDKINANSDKALHNILKPVLLVNSDNGIGVAGTEGNPSYVSGNVTVFATTYNAEVASPAVKKYLRVNGANGKFIESSSNDITSQLHKGMNTVEYYALDYTGQQGGGVYYIYVK